MIRIMTKIGLFLAVMAFVPLLLIAIQPVQSSHLSAFMFDEDCPAPCFMGIQPGDLGMTQDEAIALLEPHPWVGDILMQAQATPGWEYMDRWLSWTWSGEQPDFIDAAVPGQIGLLQAGPTIRVANIRIQTETSLEDFIAVFGSPQATKFVYDVYSAAPHRFIARLEPQVQILTSVTCPLRQSAIVQQPVQLVYGRAPEILEGVSYLHPDRYFPQYSPAWLAAYPGC